MANSTQDFLMRGKLGDFIQSLYSIKVFCELHNVKANLYMYDLPSKTGWEFGIDNTYKELYPIIINQSYINSFSILEDDVDTTNFIDLGEFVNSPLLYRGTWTEIFSDLVKSPIIKGPWIEFNNLDISLSDKIIIHRRAKYELNMEFPYEEFIKQNKDSILFISTSESDYDNFPWKDGVEFHKINTMVDWFTHIGSCKAMISNISAPACIANALDVVRIIELPNMIDSHHWMGEQNYSNNIFWLLNNNINHLPV
jgi:hypothetical protein